MAGAIGPGTLLLAITDGGQLYGCPLPDLVIGRVYECLEVDSGDDTSEPCGRCGSIDVLDLCETGFDPDWGYCPCAFVPAGRRGDFESLLRKADEPARVDA